LRQNLPKIVSVEQGFILTSEGELSKQCDIIIHLKKDYVITDGDYMGYTSYFYEDREGTEINALLHFYLSIYEEVEAYIQKLQLSDKQTYGFTPNRSTY